MKDDVTGAFRSRAPRVVLAVVVAGALGGAAPAIAAPSPGRASQAGGPAVAAPFVYTANHGRNDVSQFAAPLAGHGALRPLTPPAVAAGHFPIGVAVSPEGNSAYVINTDGNTISQYRVDPATGKLSPLSPATVATASQPGAVAISPDGKDLYVALDDVIAQ
jgi:DNA-binding beta-propeller fold protein YncE